MKNINTIILIIFLVLITQNVIAQSETYTVAYVNSKELLEMFPEKEDAAAKLLELSDSYKSELEFMQNEYNKKYSDYIAYQSTLSENIKLRRMRELSELENKIQQFIQLAQQDIEQQELMLLSPLKEKVMQAIREVGLENQFIVIYDVADPSIAFVNPAAFNANDLVIEKLNIRQQQY